MSFLLLLLAAATAPRVAIFDGAAGRAVLSQCSRGAPAPIGPWRPTRAQVEQVEPAVVAAFAARARRDRDDQPVDLADLRRRWHVEATGVTIGGRRQLYLSYVPNWVTHPGPTMICDGGPQLFGATVDLATGRVVALDFNGVA